jgi:hypothetical protein
MIPQEVILAKRNGETLPPVEIYEFIKALAENRISEGQVAAFAMARLVSSSMWDMALRLPSWARIWAKHALATSVGENFLAKKPLARAWAVIQFNSLAIEIPWFSRAWQSHGRKLTNLNGK